MKMQRSDFVALRCKGGEVIWRTHILPSLILEMEIVSLGYLMGMEVEKWLNLFKITLPKI